MEEPPKKVEIPKKEEPKKEEPKKEEPKPQPPAEVFPRSGYTLPNSIPRSCFLFSLQKKPVAAAAENPKAKEITDSIEKIKKNDPAFVYIHLQHNFSNLIADTISFKRA